MFAAAVSAFDLEKINVLDRLRIAKNVVMAAANVAAKKITEFFFFLANVENDLRGPENVADIAERHRHTVGDLNRTIVIQRDELADRLLGIGNVVKGFYRPKPLLGALLRNEFGVRALNLGGIF